MPAQIIRLDDHRYARLDELPGFFDAYRECKRNPNVSMRKLDALTEIENPIGGAFWQMMLGVVEDNELPKYLAALAPAYDCPVVSLDEYRARKEASR